MSLMDHFPGIPRGEQENVVNQIDEAFYTDEKKFVICQAPTGSGKSHIGATVALASSEATDEFLFSHITPKNHYGRKIHPSSRFGSYILTTSKALQDQYELLFPRIEVLKGKRNYPCALDPLSNAGTAKCRYVRTAMEKCAMDGDCEYINSFSSAVKSNFSALNYNMYLSLPPLLQEKDVLVCDEASELEDIIVDQYSVSVNYKQLDYLGVHYSRMRNVNPENAYLWLCTLRDSVSDAMPSVKLLESQGVSATILGKATKLKDLGENLTEVLNYWSEAEYVVEEDSDGVMVAPLKVNRLSQLMFKKADKILLMSATIINHVKFAESLGINPEEYTFIDVKSDFDANKSPIYVAPAKYDMRYNQIDKSIPGLVDAVIELAEIHKNDNGIVHTHNFKITQAIKSAVGDDSRFLFRDKFSTNEDILAKHYDTDYPTILVSPSMAYGTSLDNEHGRFQIITKLPYLPMSSKRIKTLSSKDFNWYQMKMWITMIQMCGRCTRSKEDHSNTYIFDKSFISAISRYENKLPKWFVSRLV